jgi:hypothetical protein
VYLTTVVKHEGDLGIKSRAIFDRKCLYRGAMTVTCSKHIFTRWVDYRYGRNFVERGSGILSSQTAHSLNGHILWLFPITRDNKGVYFILNWDGKNFKNFKVILSCIFGCCNYLMCTCVNFCNPLPCILFIYFKFQWISLLYHIFSLMQMSVLYFILNVMSRYVLSRDLKYPVGILILFGN